MFITLDRRRFHFDFDTACALPRHNTLEAQVSTTVCALLCPCYTFTYESNAAFLDLDESEVPEYFRKNTLTPLPSRTPSQPPETPRQVSPSASDRANLSRAVTRSSRAPTPHQLVPPTSTRHEPPASTRHETPASTCHETPTSTPSQGTQPQEAGASTSKSRGKKPEKPVTKPHPPDELTEKLDMNSKARKTASKFNPAISFRPAFNYHAILNEAPVVPTRMNKRLVSIILSLLLCFPFAWFAHPSL